MSFAAAAPLPGRVDSILHPIGGRRSFVQVFSVQILVRSSCGAHQRSRKTPAPAQCESHSPHRIPSRHSRFPLQGRPRLSFRTFGSGNNGCSTAHCSSVNRLFLRFAIPQKKPQPWKKYKCHYGRLMKQFLAILAKASGYLVVEAVPASGSMPPHRKDPELEAVDRLLRAARRGARAVSQNPLLLEEAVGLALVAWVKAGCHLRPPRSGEAWMHKVGRRLAVTLLRRGSYSVRGLGERDVVVVDQRTSQEAGGQREDLERLCVVWLASLPRVQRCVADSILAGADFHSVARDLGMDRHDVRRAWAAAFGKIPRVAAQGHPPRRRQGR
jgi:DNA-directed RNA polymerase specialized sigma24 family protein